MWLNLVVLMAVLPALVPGEADGEPTPQQVRVFITGCGSGFGNLLARHCTCMAWGYKAVCLMQSGGRAAVEPDIKQAERGFATSQRQRAMLQQPHGWRGVWGTDGSLSARETLDSSGRRFQSVSQDVKSYLPSSPHSADQMSLFHPWPPPPDLEAL